MFLLRQPRRNGGLKDLLGHFDRAFDRTDKVIGGAALAGALLNDRETKEDRLDRENKELKEQLNREWERDTIEICRQCLRPDSDNDR